MAAHRALGLQPDGLARVGHAHGAEAQPHRDRLLGDGGDGEQRSVGDRQVDGAIERRPGAWRAVEGHEHAVDAVARTGRCPRDDLLNVVDDHLHHLLGSM